jgi:hypothetical protein
MPKPWTSTSTSPRRRDRCGSNLKRHFIRQMHSGGRFGQMKTRDFTSDADVAALVNAFETARIPASEFTHAAHIAVALSYLADLPADQALRKMRERVRAFASAHGKGNLYHETLTTFWMRLLDHVGRNCDLPLWQRINLIVARWGTRAPVEAHYSPELIKSQGARQRWIPPDRLPLPF